MNFIYNALWWTITPFLVAQLFVSMAVLYLDRADFKNFSVVESSKKTLYNPPKFFLKYKISKPKPQQKQKNTQKFKGVSLKAVYLSETAKFIMIEDKKDISFVDINKTYKDAKLIKIYKNRAIFSKDGKEIILRMSEDNKNGNKKKILREKDRKNFIKKRLANRDLSDGRYVTVKRDDFKNYTKNPKSFLRDIKIRDLKDKNGKFDGMSITFVRRGSLFDKMGLKRGDIIKEIDGKRLNNVMDVFSYYNRLSNISTIKITIQRDEEMKEIIYEID